MSKHLRFIKNMAKNKQKEEEANEYQTSFTENAGYLSLARGNLIQYNTNDVFKEHSIQKVHMKK